MYDVKHLNELMEIIESPKNCACFKAMLKTCETTEFLTIILYNNGAIGENEKLELINRINTVKRKAILEHKQAIKNSINECQVFGTLGSFIDFIYDDIFGE